MYQVLLVDDEEMVTQGLTRFVPWAKEGYAVAGTAASADEAMAFLAARPVDLVITDVMMPEKTGLELIEMMRESHPGIKTAILSGYSEFALAQQALRLGALDYLTKPVNFGAMRVLLQKIRVLLDRERSESREEEKMRETLAATLMMNFACGDPYDAARAAVCLDTACPIMAARISDRGHSAIPEEAVRALRERFAPCRAVALTAEELLLVLEGERDTADVTAALEGWMKEHSQAKLCAGLSERQVNYSRLREAAVQAANALRYQNARSSEGVMTYDRVRDMYTGFAAESDRAIRTMTELLISPEGRSRLLPTLRDALTALSHQAGYSLSTAQRFATKLLVELDAPIQRFELNDYPRHDLLIEALMAVMETDSLPALQALFARFFGRLLDALNALDDAQTNGRLIDRVQSYLRSHFAENITLAVLSETFYVSPVYLSRLFKRQTGVNFVDYLTRLRLEQAKAYLRDPNCKVYHVAERVGYENPRYFAKLFKEATGMSPQDYRKAGESTRHPSA